MTIYFINGEPIEQIDLSEIGRNPKRMQQDYDLKLRVALSIENGVPDSEIEQLMQHSPSEQYSN